MRVATDEDSQTRIRDSVARAFSYGGGICEIVTDEGVREFSSRFEADGIEFEHPSEHLFSFNNPLGACPRCEGYGKVIGIDEDLVIPDKSKTIYEDAVACWRGETMRKWKQQLVENASKFGFPDPHAVPRTDARAETPAVARQRIFPRTRRIFRIHRLGAAQNPVPRDEGPLHGQDHLSRMRRLAPAQRGVVRTRRRQDDRRSGGDARGLPDRLLRRAGTRRTRHENGVAHPRRNPQPPAIPRRRGAGLPDARPPVVDPLGRREPAHQPLDLAGQQPHRFALHPRRTVDRASSARHEPPDRRIETAARPGQHGDRRGARGGGDPRRGLDRRHRTQGRLQRRRSGLQRHAAPTAEKQKEPHGRLPHGAAPRSPFRQQPADGATR